MEKNIKRLIIYGNPKESDNKHKFSNFSPLNNTGKFPGPQVALTVGDLRGVIRDYQLTPPCDQLIVSRIKLIRNMEKFIERGLSSDSIESNGFKHNVINICDKSQTLADGYNSTTINSGDRSVSMNYGSYSTAVNTGNESISRTMGDCSISSTTGHNSVSVGFLGSQSVSISTGIRSASVSQGIQGVSLCTGCNSISEVILKRSVAVTSDKKSISLSRALDSVSLSTGSESISVCEEQRSIAICTGNDSSAKVGEDGIAFGFGEGSIVSGRLGSWLVLADRSCGIKNVIVVKVDGDSIKPGTWYTLDNDGNIIEADKKKVIKQTSTEDEVYKYYFLYHGNKKKYKGCYCCITASKTIEGAKVIVNNKFSNDGSWRYFGDEKEWTDISSLRLPPNSKFDDVKCYADVWGLREVKV